MASTYVRRFNLKDFLNDEQVGKFWHFLLSEFMPAIHTIKGVRAVKAYSGAGALRADVRLTLDMDDAGVYDICFVIRRSTACLARSIVPLI